MTQRFLPALLLTTFFSTACTDKAPGSGIADASVQPPNVRDMYTGGDRRDDPPVGGQNAGGAEPPPGGQNVGGDEPPPGGQGGVEPPLGGQNAGGVEPPLGGQNAGGVEPPLGGQNAGGAGGQSGDPCVDVGCPFGEVCDPSNGDCVPDAANDGIGHGCDSPQGCPEGQCITEEESGGALPGGLCAVECFGDEDCAGGLCHPSAQICLARCEIGDACRGGWTCYEIPDAGFGVCVPDCNDAGCDIGQVCDAGTGLCEDEGGLGCVSDDECGFNEVCDVGTGRCLPGDPAECFGDFDCGPGELCDAITRLCAPVGGGCIDDADCGRFEFCNAGTGACEAAPVGCASDDDCDIGELCNPASLACEPARVGCEDDLDCPFFERCDQAQGLCVPEGFGCVDDADCLEAEVCDIDFGVCLPAAECNNDFDCPIGAVCDAVTNLCVPDQSDCRASGCPGGQACNERTGLCEPGAGGGGAKGDACAGPDDCGFGLICVGFGPDVALCLGACDATQIINGCAPREICLPFDDAVPEDAACLPGDDCSPANAEAICGAPAYCVSAAPASFCATAGDVPVGGDCSPADDLGCAVGLVCEFGTCHAPCGRAGACPRGQSCIDYTARLDGVAYAFCHAECDVFAQVGCGAAETCVPATVDDRGLVVGACAGVPDGLLVHGVACVEDDQTYFGSCTGGHYCAPLEEGGNAECIGLCDVDSSANCGGPSTCVTGIFGGEFSDLGLCLGECDPFAAAGCGRGESCTFSGQIGVGDAGQPVGFCAPGDRSAAVGEPCIVDDITGGSDCAVGDLCTSIEAGDDPVCVALCDTAPGSVETCGPAFACTVGVFGSDDLGLGGNQRFGVCTAQ